MEAVVAALRPKQIATISREFRPSAYEIMLIDVKLDNAPAKQLPRTTFRFDEEPSEVLCSFLYEITGGECDGLKARRAVFVPAHHREPEAEYDSSLKGALYALPVDPRDKLCAEVLQRPAETPGFYSYDQVLDTLAAGQVLFPKQTRTMLSRMERWLEEKHNVPGAIDLLFSACAEDRLTRSVTNPAFFTVNQSKFNSVQVSEGLTMSIANEALAKMMAIEKCDRTIVNPVFGSEPKYKALVDKSAVNMYFGTRKPDYSKIKLPDGTAKLQRKGSHRIWSEEFPLHNATLEGDGVKMREMLLSGYSASKKDHDGWSPIHYAAWYGHVEAIKILVTEGEISPNLENHKLSTPLHIAASNGRRKVVELLLNNPDVDVEALDKHGKTALDHCSGSTKDEWQRCAHLLEDAMNRPVAMIPVCLMDGSTRDVKLSSGERTTVYQMHSQMLRSLELPDSCGHLFTIWICSRNLQLQLKSEHRPIEHLTEWKASIVVKYTDQEPTREDPQLFWRRDAVSVISQEKMIRNPVATSLLFTEAYHHYIKNLYPCADGDVLILGGILMQLHLGDYEQKKCQKYFALDKALHQLVPSSKLKSNVKWSTKITAQYKHYSNTMVTREDRSNYVLHQHFLKICWNLTVYGSAFFTGTVNLRSKSNSIPVYIGVNDIGVHVINGSTRQMVQSYCYADIEWLHKKNVLEIKQRGSDRLGMSLVSKQAGLVDYLMRKLSHGGMIDS